MKARVSVAVIGCGYWGPNLVRNLRGLPDGEVVAVCDPDERRLAHLAGLYPDLRLERDFRRLIASPDIDAVVIATPIRHHYAQARASLLAGKHTFIEKPMAASVAECEELVELARRSGVVLMVGHTYLYSAAVRWISGRVRAGELGEIRSISARRLNLGLFQDDVNVAWDLAPHDLSIILHLLDETPATINCQGHAHVTPGVEDVTNLSLGFASGRFATIQSSWLEPRKVREMTIVGTRKMIVYNDLEPLEKVRVFDVRIDRPPHADTFAEFLYSYHYGDSHIPRIEQEEPLRTECRHFLECVASGAEPLTGGRAGLEIVRILEAASRSLRRQGAPERLAGSRRPVPVELIPAPAFSA